MSDTDGGWAQPDAIPVAGLRTTFFWPLALDLPPVTNTAFWRARRGGEVDFGRLCDEQIGLIADTPWTRLWDPLAHAGGLATDTDIAGREADRAAALAEFAYFHDFVQHFLFRRQRGGAGEAPETEPFHLYARSDIKTLAVTLQPGLDGAEGERRLRLAVERLRLYVFRIGVAVLAVEVATGPQPHLETRAPDGTTGRRPLALADVLDLNDRLRRVYAPFHPLSGAGPAARRIEPDLVPRAVRWLGEDDAVVLDVAHQPTPDERIDRLWAQGDDRTIPPFTVWGALWPQGWRIGATGSEDLSWRQVFDERMPLLSWVSVSPETEGPLAETHYARIRRGDWMRLCFVDPAGRAPYPYDPDFLRAFDAENTYDRFHDVPPAAGTERNGRTRFLISSYALVSVGCGWFYDTFVSVHMRRQYFQMALLLHVELAALLALSGRISRAMADYEDEDTLLATRAEAERNLSDRLQTIERDFLQFVHRFRFTGVSNQLQGSEMFDQMRARMRLPAIYADLKDEITTATDFLATRAAERQADAAARLSIVATLGLVLGLPMAFLGMNVLGSSDFLAELGVPKGKAGLSRHVLTFAGAACVAFAAALGLMVALHGRWRLRSATVDGVLRRGRRFIARHLPAGQDEATTTLVFLLATGSVVLFGVCAFIAWPFLSQGAGAALILLLGVAAAVTWLPGRR